MIRNPILAAMGYHHVNKNWGQTRRLASTSPAALMAEIHIFMRGVSQKPLDANAKSNFGGNHTTVQHVFPFTLWLFDLANWKITIFIGKSS